MPPTDDEIRKMAKARVEFRMHLLSYVVVNIFLAGLWFTTSRGDSYWPAWVHLGWGVGLAFNAYSAYGSSGTAAIEREEQKLRERYGRA